MSIVKDEARRILDTIPDDATWEDIMYHFYVQKKVDDAIRAGETGDVISQEEMERQFPNANER